MMTLVIQPPNDQRNATTDTTVVNPIGVTNLSAYVPQLHRDFINNPAVPKTTSIIIPCYAITRLPPPHSPYIPSRTILLFFPCDMPIPSHMSNLDHVHNLSNTIQQQYHPHSISACKCITTCRPTGRPWKDLYHHWTC